jgi:hypothetical protein
VKLPRVVVAAAKQPDAKATTAAPNAESQMPPELALLASMFGEVLLLVG